MVSRSAHQSITHLLFLSFLTTAFVAHGMQDQQKGLQHRPTKQNALSRLDGFFDSLVAAGHSQYSLQHPLSEYERSAVEGVDSLIPAVRARLEINTVFMEKEQKARDKVTLSPDSDRCQAVEIWKKACAETDRWDAEKAEVNKIDQERLALSDATLSRYRTIRKLFQFDAKQFPLNAEINKKELGMLVGADPKVLGGAAARIKHLLEEDDELKKAQEPAHKEPAAMSQAAEKAAIPSAVAQGGLLLAQRRRGSIV